MERSFELDLQEKGIGFRIVSLEHENRGQDKEGIYISEVLKGGAADVAGLKVGDRLKSVNGHDFMAISHHDAVGVLEALGSKASFLVLREAPSSSLRPPSVTSAGSNSVFSGSTSALHPPPGPFACRLSELVQLISERDTNGLERLSDFGGYKTICAKLKSDPEKGISGTNEDIEERIRWFGANRIPTGKPKTFWQLVIDAMEDVLLRVLLVCGIVSAILGGTVDEEKSTAWIEGVAIMASVIIVVTVTALNNLQRERQFQSLQAEQEGQTTVSVIRNGALLNVPIFDLVVGDIYQIQTGDLIPADGILISSSELACDESALTGESDVLKKSPTKNPFLLSGTAVKQGTGTMVVTCVGLYSEEGTINRLITGNGQEEVERLESLYNESSKTKKEETGSFNKEARMDQEKKQERIAHERKRKTKASILQAKLNRLAIRIGYVGLFVAALVFIILLIRYCVEEFGVNGEGYSGAIWTDILSFVIISITILVVTVPEGLPLAVTIALAYSVKRMMSDNNLVRVLPACETMGNATTICSDKTGTLTKNRMTVVRAYSNGKDYYDPTGIATIPSSTREKIGQAIAWNSSRESKYFFAHKHDVLPAQHGNKTECAILQFADSVCDKTYGKYREDMPSTSYVKEFPFSSAKKRMSTVVKVDGVYRMYTKGASEILLDLATHEEVEGVAVPLPDHKKEDIRRNIIISYAEQALRVILLGYCEFDSEQDWENEDELLKKGGLVIVAIVGIQDPVRDEVPQAVKTCKDAGIVVRMVTGDNIVTARAISVNCGILDPTENFIVMEGPDFRRRVLKPNGKINYDEFDRIWPNLRVLARCSPTDKYTLVKGLMRNRQVVAVTGDGTNDGPALSEADVGFAMGIAGTSVAKEASDIIILDDNFSSIVKAVSWGRNVYDSIAKFLTFQLTATTVAVSTAFIGACMNEIPLRAIQLLWVNLIINSMASLALATESPTPELLKRKPKGLDSPLISRIMLRQISGHAVYQFSIIMMLLFYGHEIFGVDKHVHTIHKDPSKHYTIVFNTFVFFQVFNEINARKIYNQINVFKGITHNPLFLIVLTIMIVVQIIFVTFGGKALAVKALSWQEFLGCVAFGASGLVWNVVIHYFYPYRILPERLRKKKTKVGRGKEEEEEEEEEEAAEDVEVTVSVADKEDSREDSDLPDASRVPLSLAKRDSLVHLHAIADEGILPNDPLCAHSIRVSTLFKVARQELASVLPLISSSSLHGKSASDISENDNVPSASDEEISLVMLPQVGLSTEKPTSTTHNEDSTKMPNSNNFLEPNVNAIDLRSVNEFRNVTDMNNDPLTESISLINPTFNLDMAPYTDLPIPVISLQTANQNTLTSSDVDLEQSSNIAGLVIPRVYTQSNLQDFDKNVTNDFHTLSNTALPSISESIDVDAHEIGDMENQPKDSSKI